MYEEELVLYNIQVVATDSNSFSCKNERLFKIILLNEFEMQVVLKLSSVSMREANITE